MSIASLDLRRNHRDPIMRLASRVRMADDGGCWLWTGGRHPNGYGCAVELRRASGYAHRLSYQIHVGPIPPGFTIIHSCDNPPCVNPRHLLAAPHSVNMLDRELKGRTARGDRSGAHTHPERIPRGDRHGSRTHPESFKGRRFGPAKRKLSDQDVRDIRDVYSAGGIKYREIAASYGVHTKYVAQLVQGRWRVVA